MNIALAIGIWAFAVSTVSPKVVYDEIEEDWNLFKMTYNKSYGYNSEDVYRKSVYLANKLKIDKHNKLYERGEVTFTMGMNDFGDWTAEEFLERMTGYQPLLDDVDGNNTFVRNENVSCAANVDLVKKGYVTPVKNQGQCKSCWSFSATGALEGQYFKKTGKLVSLSEQNLIDCSWKYPNNGCYGGNTMLAFDYIKSNGGIDTEESYPYRGEDDSCCRFNKQNIGAKVRGYKRLEGDDNLLAAVATVGPVSVSMFVVHSFQFYEQGIYKDWNCDTGTTNHAMLAVGYGVAMSGAKYWLVKNSWGTDWGAEGFAYMSRDVKNVCGLSINPSYPVV